MTDHEGREFTPEELQSLQAFADQAALALENARLYATAQDSLTRLRETQAQLVQAAKMSALGQLVSGVAHELNNPLSVIIGYGQLLLSREVPQPMRRPVELMVAQGDRMAKIVRNLLFFARQRPPERGAVDLQSGHRADAGAARQPAHALGHHASRRSFAPRSAGDHRRRPAARAGVPEPAAQRRAGDPRRRRPQGRIVDRARACARTGDVVYAEVIDDGPGIPPRPCRASSSRSSRRRWSGSGTGLGLSVSYGIIEEHGGRLSVQSRPGETMFTLELPVGAAAAATERPARCARCRQRRRGAWRWWWRTSRSVLDLVVALLKEHGWERGRRPTAAGPGSSASSARTYDLIVSDMRMPDGDGADVLHEGARAHDPDAGPALHLHHRRHRQPEALGVPGGRTGAGDREAVPAGACSRTRCARVMLRRLVHRVNALT